MSSGAAELLRAVDGEGLPLLAATAGISMFQDGRRPADACRHRPRTEGLRALLPYLLPAAIAGSIDVAPAGEAISSPNQNGLIVGGSGLGFGRRLDVGVGCFLALLESGKLDPESCPIALRDLSPGACVITAEVARGKSGLEQLVAAVAWKGESGAVRLHADTEARKALLRSLLGI